MVTSLIVMSLTTQNDYTDDYTDENNTETT
jgi:hypothetical protein